MYNSPMAMPQSPAVKSDTQPNDFLGWLQQTLLGGQGADNLDPSVSSLLTGLLGSNTMGAGNGQKI